MKEFVLDVDSQVNDKYRLVEVSSHALDGCLLVGG